jgi:hypothetical protein
MAAGVIKQPSPFDRIKQLLPQLSASERHELTRLLRQYRLRRP